MVLVLFYTVVDLSVDFRHFLLVRFHLLLCDGRLLFEFYIVRDRPSEVLSP